jgi:hypothetical protein
MRWEQEQQALRDRGIFFESDPAAFAAGQLILHLTAFPAERPIELRCTYPANYPYFPPMVVAPNLELRRHQTPGTKQLCLLDRGGDRWLPATDTLASLLAEKLPEVLASQPAKPDGDQLFEAKEGEPITVYLTPELGSFVGFPAFSLDALGARGILRIGMESFHPFRATTLEVTTANGQLVALSDARQHASYPGPLVAQGRWIKLPQRPACGDAAFYYQRAVELYPDLEQPAWQKPWGEKGPRIDLVAFLFEDEMTWRGIAGNVIVVAKTQEMGADGKRGKVEKRLLRAELESRDNYFLRNPSSRSLNQGVVSLVGTGSIGSPAARLLAQAGVGTLRLFDGDVLEAGNTIRWEIGRTAAGYPKVHGLHSMLANNFPYTKVESQFMKIGDPNQDSANSAHLDAAIFKGSTCILDATASTRVNQYLAEMAQIHHVPYVWMHATNGAWGGLVGIASPDSAKCCWMCHLYYLEDGTIEALSRAPEDDLIQPPGCLDPTFTGSQVDLTETALQATRVVMDQVAASVSGGQPAYTWSIATLQLRDKSGFPQLPAWKAYRLPPHANCPNH